MVRLFFTLFIAFFLCTQSFSLELDTDEDGNIESGFYDEAVLEALLDLQDLQGAITDAQVPDDITITKLNGITGIDDAVAGVCHLYGNSSTMSGYLYLHSGAGNDTTEDYWRLLSNDDQLYLGPASDMDRFVFESDGTLTAQYFEGNGEDLTLDATGFDGNLTTGDNTLQEVAQKLDDLTVEGGAVADDSILEVKLDATNSPTDDYILSYDSATGGFTWVVDATGAGGDQLVDIVATSPLLINGGASLDNALPGSDSDVTFSLGTTATLDTEWDTMAKINAVSTDTDAVLDTDIGVTVQAQNSTLQDISDSTVSATGFFNSGTVEDARLSSNVPLKNGTETISGNWTFTGDNSFGPIQFEGSTTDGYETAFSVTDPTADRSIYLGNFDMRVPASSQVDTSGNLIVDASGFNGQLTTGDDTIQEVAQKFDDFTASGSGISDVVDDTTPQLGGNLDGQAYTIDTTGDITGGQYTAAYSANQTLTAAQCRGGVIYVTSACTITLPAIADGASVTVITIGAVAVSVDTNASDLMYLDGTALDDGDKATNTSTTGDIIVLTYYSAAGWYATSNSWTDGGA